MEATIRINMDNAAFEDGCDGYSELARILKNLSNYLYEQGSTDKNLFDINGNKVGTFEIA